MNRVVFVTDAVDIPKTGGEKYNRAIADILKEKHPHTVLLTDRSFFHGNKYIMTIANNIKMLIMLWRHRNCIILFPLRTGHYMLVYLILSKICQKRKIIAIVHHLYSLHHYRSIHERLLSFLYEKITLSYCDMVIACSISTKRDILTVCRQKRIAVVYPGTDLKHIKIETHRDKNYAELLYVGSISERKGLIYLFEAFNKLVSNDIKLKIVGDISHEKKYYRQLAEYVQKNNLSTRVEFLGYASSGDLNYHFKSADIFVMPSLWEGYGIVLIEAMCYGLPIVATTVGAIPEIVKNGVNGFLVQPGDPKAMVQAISCLIENNELRFKIASRNLKKAKSFHTWQQMAQQVYEILIKI